jgi:hypothetical protein
MLEIPAADDPRVTVAMTVALKGGKTLTLSMPRFDFMDEPTHRDMTAELEKIDADETLTPRERARATTLVMLKPFVGAQDYKRCESLVVGQLAMIRDHWFAQSNITLGEYLASAPSSTATTEAPSDTTSTPEDGPDATSAAG